MIHMDDKWFKEVGRGLAQIEAANAQRYATPVAAADAFPLAMLICHPEIMASRYWHQGNDDRAVPAWFDFDKVRFPRGYIAFIRGEPPEFARRLASRAYAEGRTADNTKILVARILVLQLERLLPPGSVP
jgi:hypothetical protein